MTLRKEERLDLKEGIYIVVFQKKRTDRAIKTHEMETQGESRSPILAAFQNIPRNL